MPPIDHSRPTTVIFGCGYVGTRLARRLLAEGRPVRVCSRHPEKHAALAALGAEVHAIDATKMKQFGPALRGLLSPIIVYSIPPPYGMPGGEAVRRATHAALAAGARSFVYLGTSGLYGSSADSEWIDEETPIALDDLDMAPRHQDESSVETASLSGLRTVVLRMAAVYGPGKGVRKRLRDGKYKLIDEGRNWVSRIHVDDVVSVILAAVERAPQGSVYLVADDKPTLQREYAAWLCERLGVPLPASVASIAPGAPRTLLRGRRLRNDKMKRELLLTLRYPTYVEGEAQIEAEEAAKAGEASDAGASAVAEGGGEASESAAPVIASDAPSGVIASRPVSPPLQAKAYISAPVTVPSGPRPSCVRHVSQVAPEIDRDAASGEVLASVASFGKLLGMRRLALLVETLAPGHRSSAPHAHSKEEDIAYVLEGAPELWLDGVVYPLVPGDVVGFPPGTGAAHTILNNSASPARLLVLGEQHVEGDRVNYPIDPAMQSALAPAARWEDAPGQPLGPHDGLTDAARKAKATS